MPNSGPLLYQNNSSASSGTTGTYWSGYMSGSSSWSTTSSTFADPTNSGGNTLITRNNAGFGTVSAASSSRPGFSFTPASSTAVYLVACSAPLGENGNAGAARLWDGTNIVTTATCALASSGSQSVDLIGIYAPGTSSTVTLSIQLQANGITYLGNFTSALGNSVEFSIVRIV